MELFRNLPRSAYLLLVFGVALRVFFIVLHPRPVISDEREYHQLAVALLTTGTYGYNGVPTAYRPFAYPAIVAAVYAVVGYRPIAVKLLQALIDSLTALLLFVLARRASLRVQLATLAAWLFYLPAVLYTNVLLSESFFTFLLVLALYCLDRDVLHRSVTAVVFGLLLGILTLMKPSFFLFIVALSVVMPIVDVPLRQYKFVVFGALLVLLPWVARNAQSLGKATLATNGGINLFIGNNPQATGAYNAAFPEDILHNASNEVMADEIAYRYALEYMLDKPGRFVFMGFKKLAHLFSSEGGLLVWSFHPQPEDLSERYAVKYGSISLFTIVLINLPYGIMLLLGITGLLNAERDQLWWFVLCVLACWLVTHFIFFGGSRFHFPLMPLFTLYAVPVMFSLPQTLRDLSTTKKIILGAISLGFLAIWFAEAYTVHHALQSL